MKWGQKRALKKELKTLVRETGGKRTVGYHMALRESKKNSRLGTAFKYRIDRLKEIRDIGDDLNKQNAIKGRFAKLVKMVETLPKPLKDRSLKRKWNVLSILQTSVLLKQKSNTRGIKTYETN